MSYVGMSGVLIGLSIGEVLCHHTSSCREDTFRRIGTCLCRFDLSSRYVLRCSLRGEEEQARFHSGSGSSRSIRQVPPLIVLVAPIVFGVLGL